MSLALHQNRHHLTRCALVPEDLDSASTESSSSSDIEPDSLTGSTNPNGAEESTSQEEEDDDRFVDCDEEGQEQEQEQESQGSTGPSGVYPPAGDEEVGTNATPSTGNTDAEQNGPGCMSYSKGFEYSRS